ncbi:50S ribosomal protein L29 [Candidatus Sumerlaeota bacterium]|nr:50S ribosomal protein L29 [Candidatus Sumerlaeota bacterium]
MMRPRQLREMTDGDLRLRVAELHQALFNLRTRTATRDLTNVSAIRAHRRELARILTIMREREMSPISSPSGGGSA